MTSNPDSGLLERPQPGSSPAGVPRLRRVYERLTDSPAGDPVAARAAGFGRAQAAWAEGVPVALWRRGAEPGQDAARVGEGSGPVWAVGLGVVDALEERGAGGLAAAGRHCSALLERLERDPGEPAGLPWAGLCVHFDVAGPRAPWRGWAPVAWRVPREWWMGWEDGRVAWVGQGVGEDLPSWEEARRGFAEGGRRVEADAVRARPVEGPLRWGERVQAAQRAFAEGGLRKVVLARAAVFPAPIGRRWDPVGMVGRLADRDPTAHGYLWSDGSGGRALVGATPETLLRTERAGGARWVVTHSLAGTARRGGEEGEDRRLGEELVGCAKTAEEHGLVADRVEEVLAGVGAEVARGARRLRRLPRLQHVETPFRARLEEGVDPFAVLGALHPTPALGGSPKELARDWLRAHEALSRGPYGGVIGGVDAQGELALRVAIRCAQVTSSHVTAFVGAGIVPASDPDDEWRETQLKLSPIAAALALEADPQ